MLRHTFVTTMLDPSPFEGRGDAVDGPAGDRFRPRTGRLLIDRSALVHHGYGAGVEILRVPEREPVHRDDGMPTDDEREQVVDALQRAVGAGLLTLAEFTDRVDAALAAGSRAQMQAALQGLPAESPIVGATTASPPAFSVFGDVRTRGRWQLRARNRGITVFGDVTFDLRDSACSEAEVRIEGRTVFGDIEVIVPEGVEADLTGFTIFGDRRLELAAVPRLPNTPVVRVHGMTLFGDLRVRSAAPGSSDSPWRRMVDRWRGDPSSAGQLPPPQAPPGPHQRSG